ncbi:hypothetical protein BUALT_Bualt12G0036500 [Buddleja alternifolia]|uniref:TFIIS N-terminal domain-containing protein n=1 Tax=Buddleja alternifolia TaxID=168488 RepID=A0AAV6WN60_9LAMI|nr:hypothetical protein BUALT_Bualt12G0036500 [Buddleja alternifolia]
MENSIEKWRAYFDNANTDIFDIIENAIVVAACDRPYDFKLKRDRIAETLFSSCRLTKCIGCDDELKKNGDMIESGGSKTNEITEMDVNQRYSYGDVEELTNEIDQESEILGEVLRIKEILDNSEEQSEAALFESVRRLQLMALSVETLKVTEIGKSVNGLKKHGSKQVRDLVKTLILDWKNMVDAWADAAQAISDAEVEAESVKTSVIEEEEEGLPSPPLDEGAFFATPVSMELSQFFDDVDDYGNPQKSQEFNKNRGSDRKRTLGSWVPSKDKKAEPKRNEETVLKKKPVPCKPNKPGGGMCHNVLSGPGRPKPTVQPRVSNETKVQQKSDKVQKSNVDSEALNKMRLETAKRKLHERYQEAENAKKRRTIQVMELCDLPKQSLVQTNNQHTRPGRCSNGWR